MATKMIPSHKRSIELKYTIGSHFAEHGDRKGSISVKTNNTKGSYNYSFDGINMTSSIKGVNLLIFSYMRGGSSMNGKVFAEMDENFFVHEPLIQLAPHHYLTENKLCEVQTKQCKYVKKDIISFKIVISEKGP